ncbi:MAG: hypothetical protein HOW73_51310 [Polyangiaceae bacterium]|nr:hypothetical protein [Polyangiaceae bacterium]
MPTRPSKSEPTNGPRANGARTKVQRDNRRGSPDVVRKRRAARHFNELLAEVGGGGSKLDGRTEKRRQRMLAELREGKARGNGKALKPIDILVRVDALLALGEPLASIKKAAKPPRPVPATPDVVDGVKRLHAAYRFRPEVYAFVGIDERVVAKAGAKLGPSIAGRKHRGGTNVDRAA